MMLLRHQRDNWMGKYGTSTSPSYQNKKVISWCDRLMAWRKCYALLSGGWAARLREKKWVKDGEFCAAGAAMRSADFLFYRTLDGRLLSSLQPRQVLHCLFRSRAANTVQPVRNGKDDVEI